LIIELEILKGEGTEGAETSTQTNYGKRINPFTLQFFSPKIENHRKNETSR
jgi:hypothetical protein